MIGSGLDEDYEINSVSVGAVTNCTSTSVTVRSQRHRHGGKRFPRVGRFAFQGDRRVARVSWESLGARRVWSDTQGVIWVSEYNVGPVGRYHPATGAWREWKLPGEQPLAYAVFIDELDKVWVSDFAANTMVMFDPLTEAFHSFPLSPTGNVRQILGRAGEVGG